MTGHAVDSDGEPPRKRPRNTTAAATASASASSESKILSAPLRRPSTAESVPLAYLPVHPPQAYLAPHRSRPTAFQQPLHLTSFSYSPTRQLLLDQQRRDEALAVYRPPRMGVDLNTGLDECTWRDGSVDEGLDALLESLQAFIDRDDSGASADLLSKIKLITWRGMMTKLLLAVYEAESASSSGRAEGWQMNAMMVDGCLYLEDANSSAKLAKKTASEQAYRQQSYYGYSFEAFSTQNSPDAPFEPPNTNVQWCSVVKTNLGGVRTILGGEVDCVLPGTDAKRMDTSRFVELKTNIVIQSARDEMMFERSKLLKHYTQSFLLGVPQITVGFRTRQGQLTGLQDFRTLEIPRLVRGKAHGWDPAACTASGADLLDFVMHAVVNSASTRAAERALLDEEGDLPASWPVFRVVFEPARPKAGLHVSELSEHEASEEVLGAKRREERVGFLLRRWVEGVRARRMSALDAHRNTAPPLSLPPAPLPISAPSRLALKR